MKFDQRFAICLLFISNIKSSLCCIVDYNFHISFRRFILFLLAACPVGIFILMHLYEVCFETQRHSHWVIVFKAFISQSSSSRFNTQDTMYTSLILSQAQHRLCLNGSHRLCYLREQKKSINFSPLIVVKRFIIPYTPQCCSQKKYQISINLSLALVPKSI